MEIVSRVNDATKCTSFGVVRMGEREANTPLWLWFGRQENGQGVRVGDGLGEQHKVWNEAGARA